MFINSQAGPGRKVKQEQEQISPNQVPTIFHFSVSDVVFCVETKWTMGGDGVNAPNNTNQVKYTK